VGDAVENREARPPARPKEPAMNRIVDVHSHMFNGFYVPLEEILDHKFGIDRAIAVELGGLLKQLIGKVPPAPFTDASGWLVLSDELKSAPDFAAALAAVTRRTLREDLEGPDFGAALGRESGAARLLGHVSKLLERHHALANQPFRPEDFLNRAAESLTPAPADPPAERARLALLEELFGPKLIEVLAFHLAQVEGHIDFFCRMLVDDRKLCELLLEATYPEALQPALTVHLTMDIEPAYIPKSGARLIPCAYGFPTRQLARSAELIREAEGRLLGFAAFNPARGLPGIETCFEALYRGHAGIKIYPPLNHRPDGVPVPQGTDYTAVLDALYARCVAADVPVLAHCTPVGFEVWEGTGTCSNPDYWENVLAKHPALRLGLGHAGGGVAKYRDRLQGNRRIKNKGWFSHRDDWESPDCYARKVASLCRRYPKVYADFSYLTDLTHREDYRRRFVKNLMREAADPRFAAKAMYGSDWHMPEQVRHAGRFLETLSGLLADPGFPPGFRDRFLFRNAVAFLNLPGLLARHRERPFFTAAGAARLEAILAMAAEP
jgi:predicted TIM-barrel fold metal-dependent hydrolase